MIRIHLSLTGEEATKIKSNMEYLKMKNRSAYIRKMATDGQCLFVDPRGVRELTRLMSIAGNNLNQYARRANEVGDIYRNDIRDLQEKFQEILDNQRDIIKYYAGEHD